LTWANEIVGKLRKSPSAAAMAMLIIFMTDLYFARHLISWKYRSITHPGWGGTRP
jgi:hypothetical protein